MNIVHVMPMLSDKASGPSYSVPRLCDALIEAGNGVTLTALDWGKLDDPPSYLKTFPPGIGPRRLGRSPAMYRELFHQIKSGNVDLMHNHGMWHFTALYPGWLARKQDVPLVVSPRNAFSAWSMKHGSKAKLWFWPLLQKPALTVASCFHATAESEYNDIRRMGFRQPVAVIPNGIDVPILQKGFGGSSRTLLYLGRIHQEKGLDMLLLAWRQIQGAFGNWRLVIAGSDGAYYGPTGLLREMIELARELKLERVEFVGELLGEEKYRAYQEAELFVAVPLVQNKKTPLRAAP